MNLRTLCCTVIGVSLHFLACAQTEQEDTLERYYAYNSQLRIERIEREHVPLHGDSVDMIPFRVDERYGFVDKATGNWLIKPVYSEVFAVYRQGAIVKGGNGYGFMNRSGKAIIPLQFHNLVREGNLFRGSLFSVVDTNIKNELYHAYILSMYFNENGHFLFREDAHDFSPFLDSDTVTWFRYGRSYHVRGRSGALLRVFNMDSSRSFIAICKNLLIFQSSKDGHFIYKAEDCTGQIRFRLPIDERVDGVYQLSAGLYGYYMEDGDYFFCDEKGQVKPYGLVSSSVGLVRYSGDYFDQDYFVVTDLDSGRYGMVNRKGDTILPFIYQFLAKTGKDTYLADHQVFINHKGDTLLKMEYAVGRETIQLLGLIGEEVDLPQERFLIRSPWLQVLTDEHGRQYIGGDQDQALHYYINMKGDTLLTLPGNTVFATNFSDGLALVTDSSEKAGFINEQGKLVIPHAYELTMAGSYPLPYLVCPKFDGGFAYIKSYKAYIDRKGKKYFSGKRVQDHYDFSH